MIYFKEISTLFACGRAPEITTIQIGQNPIMWAIQLEWFWPESLPGPIFFLIREKNYLEKEDTADRTH